MNKLEKKFKSRLKKNEPMKGHTTFKIGGPAKYFLKVKSGRELIEAVGLAKADGLDYAVIGKGSNLLVSDKGFDGLVIRMSDVGCQMSDDTKLRVGTGLSLRELSQFAMDRGLTGVEWAYGVPGTVGGAVVMNAGCFGGEIGDIVVKVKYLDSGVSSNSMISSNSSNGRSNSSNGSISFFDCARNRSPQVKFNDNKLINSINNKHCKFGYRESVFKEHPEWIVLEVELKLDKGERKGIKKKMQEYLDKRKSGQPVLPSAGSIFKKYEIGRGEKLKPSLEKILRKEHPEFLRGKYIPAGWLIEELGLKGKRIGGAEISEGHGNFIVNLGEATAEQVIILISLIKQKVRNNFGIQLKEEVMYLGF